KEIQEKYANDLKGDNTTLQRLAVDLLNRSRNTTETPAMRWAMLSTARDVTMRTSDSGLAIAVIDEMARSFVVDGMGEELTALEQMARQGKNANAHFMTDAAVRLSDEAIAADEFDTAVRAANLAVAMAGESKAPPVRMASVQSCAAQAESLRREYGKIEK